MNKFITDRRFWLIPILAFGLLTLISVYWNLGNLNSMAERLAYERAQSMFKLVEMTRLWNARHGGVYVPVTDESPSNPYLEVPDKDITTTTGRRLTKLNPAYMTRQIADIAREFGDIHFHITSLNPINPNNIPDQWESFALSLLEINTKEVLEYREHDEKAVYRYMGPLITKKSCMKCHEKQGYVVGDIRGGISITLPAAPILDAQSATRDQIIVIHLILFILIIGMTLFYLNKMRQQWLSLSDAQNKVKEP
ncbi:MAG: DUF3365 domain-containing protein [Candidatus Thiodiazotropha sp. (ex Lucinoma borealis)]|nr:DUF3365 domain-containing protein [Candidatus Thiodiazotropha sp. (ex Lucinoma borealis)]MCU7841231.1 DUF3365 domain-containing protein [Candidatus Thiodiazotropha sp. (ex Troendleina suluensis)]MCU7854951.1 DUF3365 domain-containing protein [Candidatus Thiodiazotropha sp. (ex Lucinoma borealis)]MCU7863736.1 DUF3365 domain-containing protein [Candidatus Thiodiazotropha sp. (ex Lucinoma borealis)]MCU7870135.1 DUF3365 domain-containing protein [Candidatus Thiodiazotropha sp. (ex Lucinoma borea